MSTRGRAAWVPGLGVQGLNHMSRGCCLWPSFPPFPHPSPPEIPAAGGVPLSTYSKPQCSGLLPSPRSQVSMPLLLFCLPRSWLPPFTWTASLQPLNLSLGVHTAGKSSKTSLPPAALISCLLHCPEASRPFPLLLALITSLGSKYT